MEKINTFVKAQFLDARYKRAVVHEHDLRRWALEKNREVNWTRIRISKLIADLLCYLVCIYF